MHVLDKTSTIVACAKLYVSCLIRSASAFKYLVAVWQINRCPLYLTPPLSSFSVALKVKQLSNLFTRAELPNHAVCLCPSDYPLSYKHASF